MDNLFWRGNRLASGLCPLPFGFRNQRMAYTDRQKLGIIPELSGTIPKVTIHEEPLWFTPRKPRTVLFLLEVFLN